MDPRTVLKHVDHTLLRPDATREEIQTLCREALEYGCASVCIHSYRISDAYEVLLGAIPICTVVGFPLGANTMAAKLYEAKNAISLGAQEVDMVANIGAFKDGRLKEVEDEIAVIREALGGRILKVIIEACLLTDEEKALMCRVIENGGGHYVKTSTGFGAGGATEHDVKLLVRESAGRLKVKAAGGIRTYEDMERFLSLGADRLGCSSAVRIVREMERAQRG